MVFNIEQLAYFVILGVFGAIAFVLVNSESYTDFFVFDSVRRYLIGAVVGGIYDLLYSDYSFPNGVMCIVAGYTGTHFLEGLIEKFSNNEP